MSSLTKSLEKRIQELTLFIETQNNELSAYKQVLAVEMGKTDTTDVSAVGLPDKPTSHVSTRKARKEEMHAAEMPSSAATPDLSDLEFAGNKTNLVAAIVQRYGDMGSTPKEVDNVFTERDVPRSKNLIYNTLSYLVAQKKLVRKEGRYYATGATVKPAKRGPKPKKKSVKPAKRKMSAEGIERIRAANQKRWAAKRAADAATTKAPSKKRGRKKKAA